MDDDRLLHELKLVLDAVDQPDARDEQVAVAAFDWRDAAAELATLTFDSTEADSVSPVGVRGSQGERVLTFSTEAVVVEVELTEGRLNGQIVPPMPCTVSVRRPGLGDAGAPVLADRLGVFRIEGLDRGPISLVCAAGDGSWMVRTEWIVV